MSPSGMWCCVDLALTDVSEERIASIFRVEKSASGEPATCNSQTPMEKGKRGLIIYFELLLSLRN
jgi:hypothetical protein